FGESDYLIELTAYLLTLHSNNRTVQVDVLSARQIWMKACADFKQASCPAVDVHLARRRLNNLCKNFQECGFTRPVASNDAGYFARFDLKTDILKRPKQVIPLRFTPVATMRKRSFHCFDEHLAQGRIDATVPADSILLTQISDLND